MLWTSGNKAMHSAFHLSLQPIINSYFHLHVTLNTIAYSNAKYHIIIYTYRYRPTLLWIDQIIQMFFFDCVLHTTCVLGAYRPSRSAPIVIDTWITLLGLHTSVRVHIKFCTLALDKKWLYINGNYRGFFSLRWGILHLSNGNTLWPCLKCSFQQLYWIHLI